MLVDQHAGVDRLQRPGHRGLAVGRDPDRGEPAVLARAELQGALPGLLEDEAVIGDAALAAAPDSVVLAVDAGADRIDGGQLIALGRFDPEQNLAPVRVEAVPDIAEPDRCLAAPCGRAPEPVAVTADSAARGARGSAMSGGSFRSALGIVPQRGAQTISPLRSSLVREIADAVAEAPQEQPARRGPMRRQIGRLIDYG